MGASIATMQSDKQATCSSQLVQGRQASTPVYSAWTQPLRTGFCRWSDMHHNPIMMQLEVHREVSQADLV